MRDLRCESRYFMKSALLLSFHESSCACIWLSVRFLGSVGWIRSMGKVSGKFKL